MNESYLLMFRILSFLLFLLFIVGMFVITKNRREFWQNFLFFVKKPLHLFKSNRNIKSTNVFVAIKMIIYLFVLLCVVLLTISGFIHPLFLGETPSGFLLLLHVTVAPIFAVAMAAFALLWANNHSFTKNDWIWLQGKVRNQSKNQVRSEDVSTGQKVFFWICLSLSLPVILSIVLSMFQYFGTYGQEYLFQIHRYSALIFVITFTLHFYFSIARKK